MTNEPEPFPLPPREPGGFVPRGRHLFVYDVVAIAIAIVGAFALRFDANDVFGLMQPNLPVALLPLVVQPVANVIFGLYRREWRYASVREMLGIASAVGAGTVVSAAIFVVLSSFHAPSTAGMPRSFFALEGLLALIIIGGGRFALRWSLENGRRSGGNAEEIGSSTIVYGAGEAGAGLARMASRDRRMGIRVAGFLDDDPHKRGSRLGAIKIFGGLERLDEAARATRAERLVVAMPSAAGSVVRRAVEEGRRLGLAVSIVPPFHELLGHYDGVVRVRPVRLEDLLGREPVNVDVEGLADYLNGATVLVTGGGGSIGSELARQIQSLGPRQLFIADNNEAALWRIGQELDERHGSSGPGVTTKLCDIRSAAAVQHLLALVEPDVVFHAAALKHVPICEMQPAEAVLTNVLGTKHLLEASDAAGVSRFVLISTDKAVQPVSVMGATKRVAEILTLQAGHATGRPHMAVRFGNVLGSSGSVVPIFQRQLAMGLPLTVTHPDAMRYFMTIPEAVSLILEAGSSQTVGDIFILDMGEPVRILDLAEDMIRLSGIDRSRVDIIFTGLRPGERLEERLFYDHESMEPTTHERILRVASAPSRRIRRPITELVADLASAATAADDRRVREILVRSGIFHGQPEGVIPESSLTVADPG